MLRKPWVVLDGPVVPTYTFPLTTLGIANFTAVPEGTSELGATTVQAVFDACWLVVYRQFRVVASKAQRLAGPLLVARRASISQTIACGDVTLGEETVGVGPGQPKVKAD